MLGWPKYGKGAPVGGDCGFKSRSQQHYGEGVNIVGIVKLEVEPVLTSQINKGGKLPAIFFPITKNMMFFICKDKLNLKHEGKNEMSIL